jgi:hypothetical protein
VGVADQVQAVDSGGVEGGLVVGELVVQGAVAGAAGDQGEGVDVEGDLPAGPQMDQPGLAGFVGEHEVLGQDRHAQLGEPLVHPLLLEGVPQVGPEGVPVRGVGDLPALPREELGSGGGHVIPVAVDDQDVVAELLALQDELLRGGDVGPGRVRAGDPVVGRSVHPVTDPVRAGGGDDDLGAVLADVVDGHPGVRDELDVAQLGDLPLPVLRNAPPSPQPGHRRHPVEMAAHLRAGVDQVDGLEPAPAQDDRGLHPCRSGADNEDGLVGIAGGGELLRVPAAAVLLAAGGVLGAPDRRPAHLPAGDADVAADALTDVLEPAFLDLLGQERVRDRRAGGANNVGLARVDDTDHHVRVGEPTHVDARLARHLLGDPGVLRLVIGLEETCGAGVLAPVHRADVQVPVVDEVVQCRDELLALLVRADAEVAVAVGVLEGVDREAHADGDAVDLGTQVLQHLAGEPDPVLERAAVLVGALVVERIEEVDREGSVAGVEGQQVEPGVLGPHEALDVLAAQGRDLPLGQGAAVGHVVDVVGDLGDDLAGRPRLGVLGDAAGVAQLDAGKGVVGVDGVGHLPQVAHVAGVPELAGDPGHDVTAGGDRADLGEDRRPAALGLHPAEGGLEPGLVRAGAVAVRDLPEPVPQRVRADPDRLEQDVVLGFAGHDGPPGRP